ncbi:phospholipid-transporting ATPase ABCA3-like [Haemaphysalis longicornis]
MCRQNNHVVWASQWEGTAEVSKERVQGRSFLWAHQLHVILWKNVYLRRLVRHYPSTILEILLMIFLLYGIQEESVVREPLLRRPDMIYQPVRPREFWNQQPDMSRIEQVVFFAPNNSYVARLTHEAFAYLGITNVIEVTTEKKLREKARDVEIQGIPARVLVLHYTNIQEDEMGKGIDGLHVSIFAGALPFDIHLHYPRRLVAQPEGPATQERFPEMNTLLPVVAALQQRHLQMQAAVFNYSHPISPVTLQRFPYPSHIEYKDTKNNALVLTRFCIGMLIPFSVLVYTITDEKSTGMREMLRLIGVNDWVLWIGHHLSALFMHTIISTLMLLFMMVKRNQEGKPFIYYSDPLLLFWILMHFCHSCLLHAMLLSVLFASRQSAVAVAMLYWIFSCTMSFVTLENANGMGYHYIQRKYKLLTSIFPGMSLHWSFRVLGRFEKFAEDGANWSNFADPDATPDNVTILEIVLVGVFSDCAIVFLIWYLDNVLHTGPGIPKSYFFPLKQTVSDYLKNKEKILQAAEEVSAVKQKNLRDGSHPKL